MEIILRDYQEKGINDILNAWNTYQSVLFQMPTGTGKTTLFCEIARLFISKFHPNKKVLIITHRRELVEQVHDRLYNGFGLKVGIISASYIENQTPQIQIASIQTLVRREQHHLDNFSLVIIDESHHALASTYRKLWEFYPSSKFLGVTATPIRTNGEGFQDLFQNLITSESIKWFINEQYLADIKYYAVPNPDLSNIKIKAGDYDENELSEIMGDSGVMADLVQSYMDFAYNKKIIVFGVKRSHVQQIVAKYNSMGFKAKFIDTVTPKDKRQKIIQDFRNNKFKILCNANIFTEGFDCPDVDGVQLARPTKSLTLYLQQVGRCMRPATGKRYGIVLDNAGLWREFGLPKMNREWSLYGSEETTINNPSQNIIGIREILDNTPEESKGIRLVEIGELENLNPNKILDLKEINIKLGDIKIETMKERIKDLEENIQRFEDLKVGENKPELIAIYEEYIQKFKKELQDLELHFQPQRFEQIMDLIKEQCSNIIDDNDIFIEGDKDTFIERFIEPHLKGAVNQNIQSTIKRNERARSTNSSPALNINPENSEIEIFHNFNIGGKAFKDIAIFNTATKKVTYGNSSNLSPSTSATQSAQNNGGSGRRNGWAFWFYIDNLGRERSINDFRS